MEKEITDLMYLIIGILALLISIILAILVERPQLIQTMKHHRNKEELIPVSSDTVVISAEGEAQ